MNFYEQMANDVTLQEAAAEVDAMLPGTPRISLRPGLRPHGDYFDARLQVGRYIETNLVEASPCIV